MDKNFWYITKQAVQAFLLYIGIAYTIFFDSASLFYFVLGIALAVYGAGICIRQKPKLVWLSPLLFFGFFVTYQEFMHTWRSLTSVVGNHIIWPWYSEYVLLQPGAMYTGDTWFEFAAFMLSQLASALTLSMIIAGAYTAVRRFLYKRPKLRASLEKWQDRVEPANKKAFYIHWIVLPILAACFINTFILQVYVTQGVSMLPTKQSGDYEIVSRWQFSQGIIERILGKKPSYVPRRGRIVSFRKFSLAPYTIFSKRVIALPGERIVIKDGGVTVYNQEYPSGFNPDTHYEAPGTKTLINVDQVIEPGHVFVMGDNRKEGESYDSREWGQLAITSIVGESVWRFYPFDRIKQL